MKSSAKKKICVLSVCLLLLMFVYFFINLPFVGVLWEADILRANMSRSISRRVDGLHLEEVILLLGEPEQDTPGWLSGFRAVPPLLYCLPNNGEYLVIFFDEDGFARHVERGHIESSAFRLNIIDLEV